MYFCLIIAILSTLLWVNVLFTENINAKVNPYQKNDEDMKNDKRIGSNNNVHFLGYYNILLVIHGK